MSRDPRSARPEPPSTDIIIDEHDVLRRLRAGESAAFDTLYLAFHARLWTFAAHVSGEVEAAEDIVQDVFLSLWTRRREVVIVPPIAAYLYGAVRNRALAMRRQAGTTARITKRLVESGTVPGAGELSGDPEHRFAAADVQAALQAAIAVLPERQRLVLRLWSEDRLDPPAIAQVLDVSAWAVRKLLAKATHKLYEILRRAEA